MKEVCFLQCNVTLSCIIQFLTPSLSHTGWQHHKQGYLPWAHLHQLSHHWERTSWSRCAWDVEWEILSNVSWHAEDQTIYQIMYYCTISTLEPVAQSTYLPLHAHTCTTYYYIIGYAPGNSFVHTCTLVICLSWGNGIIPAISKTIMALFSCNFVSSVCFG